jgi:hypothetical protein
MLAFHEVHWASTAKAATLAPSGLKTYAAHGAQK